MFLRKKRGKRPWSSHKQQFYIYVHVEFQFCIKQVHKGQMFTVKTIVKLTFRAFSSVLRLDQPNYYAYFYLKESICSMYMKLSRKFVISVVINSPKNFALHFGHVTRNDV